MAAAHLLLDQPVEISLPRFTSSQVMKDPDVPWQHAPEADGRKLVRQFHALDA
jgi:hypothetical protein